MYSNQRNSRHEQQIVPRDIRRVSPIMPLPRGLQGVGYDNELFDDRTSTGGAPDEDLEFSDSAGGGREVHAIIIAASDAPDSWKEAADYICDGTDDNLDFVTASAAAIAQSPAIRQPWWTDDDDGGTLVLSPGTFFFSSMAIIDVPNVIGYHRMSHIMWDGTGTWSGFTMLRLNSTNEPSTKYGAFKTVRGVTFSVPYDDTTDGPTSLLSVSASGVIEDCGFFYGRSSQLAASDGVIKNNFFYGCWNLAINSGGGVIEGNTFENCANGIGAAGQGSSIANNIFKSCGTDSDYEDNSVDVNGNPTYGIIGAVNCSISNNAFYRCYFSRGAIVCDQADNATIVSNVFYGQAILADGGWDTGATVFINLEECSNATVTNNQLYWNGVFLKMQYTAGVMVSNNSILMYPSVGNNETEYGVIEFYDDELREGVGPKSQGIIVSNNSFLVGDDNKDDLNIFLFRENAEVRGLTVHDNFLGFGYDRGPFTSATLPVKAIYHLKTGSNVTYFNEYNNLLSSDMPSGLFWDTYTDYILNNGGHLATEPVRFNTDIALVSPDGTVFRVGISNNGTLTVDQDNTTGQTMLTGIASLSATAQ